MTFIIDASVTLAWCFIDEQTEGALALLDRVAETGAVAPQLWRIEALNGLLTAQRRGRITVEIRQHLAGFLRQLPIEIDDETASRVWTSSAQLAGRQALTAYDATYLELAMRRGLPLATRDKQLLAAAERVGVEVLDTT